METKKIFDSQIRLYRHLRAGAGGLSAIPKRSTSSSRIRSRSTRRATSCANAPGCLVIDKRERAATHAV